MVVSRLSAEGEEGLIDGPAITSGMKVIGAAELSGVDVGTGESCVVASGTHVQFEVRSGMFVGS